jgi:T-complex protein 1 subunit theta
LKSVVSAKQFGYEDLLSPMISKACIQVLPRDPRHFNVDNVRVAKIIGGGVLDTQVIKGHVLARDTEGTIKHVKGAKVAIFSGGIDIAKTETKDTVLIKTADDLMNYNRSEEQAMEKIIKEISESGAKVVVAGSAIGEMALHFMERYKLMVVKVPSKFELRRICKAVGATPLVRLGKPTAEELGFCDVVTVEEIGSTKVTIFRQENEDQGQIATIVVRASTQNILDDIERCIDDGVNAFKALVQDNRFISGAGSAEIELSRRLQAYGDSTPGLVQYAIKKYAEAFEVVPRTLAENGGHKTIDAISNLYASHGKGNVHDGLDVTDGTVRNAIEMGVLDSLATKATAIRLATEAVLTVLRVDQIIMAKPAGGPKPPQMGGRDED